MMEAELFGLMLIIMVIIVILAIIMGLYQLGISLWIAIPSVVGIAAYLIFRWHRKCEIESEKDLPKILRKYK